MDGLCSPKIIAGILRERGLAPLKQLGQNFLVDENIVSKIAESAVGSSGNVLEIGPGLGALTNALAARSKRVVAVEIDRGMVDALTETLADRENVTVLHQDILKTDIAAVAREYFGEEPFAVAGNLPAVAGTGHGGGLSPPAYPSGVISFCKKFQEAIAIRAPIGYNAPVTSDS